LNDLLLEVDGGETARLNVSALEQQEESNNNNFNDGERIQHREVSLETLFPDILKGKSKKKTRRGSNERNQTMEEPLL